MKNRNLMLIDLTTEEMIYLSSFAKTIKCYNMTNRTYHYGTYAEDCVCINKNGENSWEVYIVEKGKIHTKETFESGFKACVEALKYAVDAEDKYKKLLEHYKKEVDKMKNDFKQIIEKNYITKIANPLLVLKK